MFRVGRSWMALSGAPDVRGNTSASAGPAVLVVEDDQLMRRCLADELGFEGFHVFEAKDGEEGIQKIQEFKNIGLVVTDVRMPRMSGLDFLAKMKARSPLLPVILMSGFADVSIEEALHRGADAILTKPTEPTLLLKTIRRSLVSLDERWDPQREMGDFPKCGMPMPAEAPLFEVELSATDLPDHRGQLNLGRGGVFLPMDSHFPEVYELIRFQVTKAGSILLAGAGVVRWSRTVETGQLPKGIGVEFLTLEAHCRQKVISFVSAEQPVPFVPRHSPQPTTLEARDSQKQEVPQ